MKKWYVRKGLFSVDASFAVIILLLMSYLFFMIVDSLNSSITILQQRQKTASLIVFTDEIVRREAAVSTNTEVIANMVSIKNLENYFSNYLSRLNQSTYGFNEINITVFSISEGIQFNNGVRFSSSSSHNIFCIDRIIVISESRKTGIMKVCVS